MARSFRWGGRDYKPGEDFNAQRMAVNQRRLQLLYDAKSIDVKGDYVPTEPEAVEETQVQDLTKLDKKELLALAAERGVAVDEKATKAQIIEALNKTDDKPEELVAGEGEFVFDTAIHAVEDYEDETWIADEAEFLVQISPNAAARLRELTEGKSLVTALEILAWPEKDETTGGEGGDNS